MYTIVDYDKRYKPYDKSGGDLKHADWVKMPANPKGDGLETLLEYKRGVEVFAVWCLLLQKATVTKKPENRGKLLNHKDEAASIPEIAKGISMKGKERLVEHALSVLVSVGWVEFDGIAEETSEEFQKVPPKSSVEKSSVEKSKCSILFDSFWSGYPRKEAKGRAVRWFAKNNPTEDDVAKMIYTIEQQKKRGGRLERRERESTKYIPLPETWLNDGDWREAPGKVELDKEQEERQQAENAREAQKQQQIRNEYIGYYEERTTKQLYELRKNRLHTERWFLIDEVLEKRRER